MKKTIAAAVFVSALIGTGAVVAQGMLLDFAADKVISKYQSSSCDQLKAMKGEPPTDKEKMAIDFLRNNLAGARRLHQQDRGTGPQ